MPVKKLTKSDTQFQIDQLRKDKIIYAIESVAVILMASLLFSSMGFLGFMFPIVNQYAKTIVQVILGIAVLFFGYMGIGNFVRLYKIKKLEKQL